MKVLVTGANGQLGFDVVKRLQLENIECHGIDRQDLDITDDVKVKAFIANFSPDVVVHCAAYTAVDKAEEEKELCYRINVLGTRYIAEACKEIDAKIVYISTDYVFDGELDRPYEVTDRPNPINYYGKTKYEGELEVQRVFDKYFIVRISWVFGAHGNNFVKTMLRLGQERDELSVVSDQMGSPTYTVDVAELLMEMIKTDKYGIYHATNEGYCSWYELAEEIYKISESNIRVTPISAKDYLTAARRPVNSRLSKGSLNNLKSGNLPTWQDAVDRYIREEVNIDESR